MKSRKITPSLLLFIGVSLFAILLAACTAPSDAPQPTQTPWVVTATPAATTEPDAVVSDATAAPEATEAPEEVATEEPEEPTDIPEPTAVPPTATPVPSPNLQSFELGGQVEFFGPNAVVAMRQSGMTWVKHLIFWSPGARYEDHVFRITEGHDLNLKVLLTVTASPVYALEENYEEYTEFLGNLAAAGADGIEVWHDQNDAGSWPLNIKDVGDYAELLQLSAIAIKNANPHTSVISGGLKPTNEFGVDGCGQDGCSDLEFLKRMVEENALSYIDCVGVHYDRGQVSPNETSGDTRGQDHNVYFQRLVEEYQLIMGERMPLCFTSLGYIAATDLGDLPPAFQWAGPQGLTPEVAAEYLGEAVDEALEREQIKLMIVYNVDFTRFDSQDPQAAFAMIRPDGECPACRELGKTMSEILPELYYAQQALPNPPTPTAIPVAEGEEPAENSAPLAVSKLTSPVVSEGFELGGQVQTFADTAIRAMNESQMRWVKHQVVWYPDSNPADYVYLIDNAHTKGFRVLLSVKGNPGFTSPDLFPTYAQFVSELAGFGPDAIEVWNEVNISREWTDGEISPETYTTLLKQAYAAIKSVSPNTMVISSALAPTGFFNGCTPSGCDDLPYLERMVAAGALDAMDCVGAHYNEGLVSPFLTNGDPRGDEGRHMYFMTQITDIYRNVTQNRHPICFTELGFLSGEEWGELPDGFTWRGLPSIGGINLTVEEHARYLGEAVQVAKQRDDIRLLIVWNVDFKVFTDDPQAGFAIIRPDGQCPACAQIANAMQAN